MYEFAPRATTSERTLSRARRWVRALLAPLAVVWLIVGLGWLGFEIRQDRLIDSGLAVDATVTTETRVTYEVDGHPTSAEVVLGGETEVGDTIELFVDVDHPSRVASEQLSALGGSLLGWWLGAMVGAVVFSFTVLVLFMVSSGSPERNRRNHLAKIERRYEAMVAEEQAEAAGMVGMAGMAASPLDDPFGERERRAGQLVAFVGGLWLIGAVAFAFSVRSLGGGSLIAAGIGAVVLTALFGVVADRHRRMAAL